MISSCYNIGLFLDSSAVEQQTVNLLVRGSIPRRGAKYKKTAFLGGFFFGGLDESIQPKSTPSFLGWQGGYLKS